MTDLIDISDALFDSGLEKDAVITHGAASYSGKCIFRNPYQRSGLMGVDYEGSSPIAICEFSMIDDWDALVNGTDTIIIDGENGGAAFKIREKKPNGPSYTILELSYD